MKRGYFSYLGPGAINKKIPRSTKWNRRKNTANTNSVLFSYGNNSEFDSNYDDLNAENGLRFTQSDTDSNGSVPRATRNVCNKSTEVYGGSDPSNSDSNDSTSNSPYSDSSTSISDTVIEELSELNESEASFSDNSNNTNTKDAIDRLLSMNVNGTVNMTIKEIMLLIYAFAVRHNLDWQTIESVTVLIKTIIGDASIPHSKYYFKKLFCNEKRIVPIVHFNCHKCKNYLGTENNLKNAEANAVCGVCATQISLNRKYRNRSLFISIPLEPQLQRHVEDAVANNSLHFPNEVIQQSNETMSDIFEGEHYKKLKDENKNKNFITITLNTDGATVFRTAKKSSIWPLQFYVNEIDKNQRFQRSNVLISSIAFGETPDMNAFLRPFLEEVQKINEVGGILIKVNGNFQRVLIIPYLWTLDSVAKCDVLNKVQFNGYNGCPYCFHPGTKVGRNDIRYSNANNTADRTDEDTRNAMIEAHQTGVRVRGYKGLSPLIVLPNFDLNWQIVIDKMHNVDLGVVKKMFDLFLSSSKESYCIRSRISEIDERLLSLKLPKQIKRNLRSLNDMQHFKASEWRTIILFVGIPILSGILPERHLKNFVKLVDAYHIFTSDEITNDDFVRGDNLIHAFVYEFEELYGVSNMVFNVHMLRHIPTCVRRNGPLCMYSNYNMEDKIGKIVSQIHGTNDVIFQAGERYLLHRNMERSLKNSSLAITYNERIRRYEKRDKHIKSSILNEEEALLIQNAAEMFEEKFINGDFYEID